MKHYQYYGRRSPVREYNFDIPREGYSRSSDFFALSRMRLQALRLRVVGLGCMA